MNIDTWKILEKILDELSENGNKIAFFKLGEHWAVDLSPTEKLEEAAFDASRKFTDESHPDDYFVIPDFKYETFQDYQLNKKKV